MIILFGGLTGLLLRDFQGYFGVIGTGCLTNGTVVRVFWGRIGKLKLLMVVGYGVLVMWIYVRWAGVYIEIHHIPRFCLYGVDC